MNKIFALSIQPSKTPPRWGNTPYFIGSRKKEKPMIKSCVLVVLGVVLACAVISSAPHKPATLTSPPEIARQVAPDVEPPSPDNTLDPERAKIIKRQQRLDRIEVLSIPAPPYVDTWKPGDAYNTNRDTWASNERHRLHALRAEYKALEDDEKDSRKP